MPENELFEKLLRVEWLLRRHQMRGHAGHGPFVSPVSGQGRVLALLKLQPELNTKDMAYLLGIRQQSLSELLGKLEKNGYVVRTPSEADKRVIAIRLTDKGKNAPQPGSDYGEIFACLNADEQGKLGEYLDRITAALESRTEDESNEELRDWIRSARERIGEEELQRLMSMRGRFGGMGSAHMHGRHCGRDSGGCGRGKHGHHGHSHASDGERGHHGDNAPED